MLLNTQQILLCIASCTHMAMLCDLEQRKPEGERDYEGFDPNDEILLRIFLTPALLDGLRTGRFDTDQGAKTDIILLWSIGAHLYTEAANLTELVFEELVAIYETMTAKRNSDWWQRVPDEYKEENRPGLEKSERMLAEQIADWRNQRAGNRTE